MRTTITLEAEAEALVKQVMKERGMTFKEAVNEAIVRALRPPQKRSIDLPTFQMGPPRVDLDKATQLAGELENAEILRKMSMGK